MEFINIFKKMFMAAIAVTAILFLIAWKSESALSINDKPEVLDVRNHLCYMKMNDTRKFARINSDATIIYFVTPTYPRPVQIPELTRLAQTLMHVPYLHWIIADDRRSCSQQIFNILRRSGLPYTHIASPKPYKYKNNNYPRGVSNRRAALKWIGENVKEGVLYFGDDDNTVDLRLFKEIRKTKKLSMFPVGLIGEYGVSSPVVYDGKVMEFFDSWPASRKFPVDMAGFAINIKHLNPNATMPYAVGYEEDRFLVNLGFKVEDIEPLADNCTKVLVWHTRTYRYKKPFLKLNLDMLKQKPKYESFSSLLEEVLNLGMAEINLSNGILPYSYQNGLQHKLFNSN